MTPSDLLDALLSYIEAPYTRTYWYELEQEPGAPQVDGKLVMNRLGTLAVAAARDREYVLRAIAEEQQRVQTLAEFGEACEFFLVDEPRMEQKAVDKWLTQPHVPALFEHLLSQIGDDGFEAPGAYETLLKSYQAEQGMEKLGPIVHPTRVALTGKTTGPGLFELMSVLGPERIRVRLKRALALCEGTTA